jgi:hypothetical protein
MPAAATLQAIYIHVSVDWSAGWIGELSATAIQVLVLREEVVLAGW